MKSLRAKKMLGLVARKVKQNIEYMLKDEEENRIIKGIISNKILCFMFSYAFHYHKAIAVMS